MLELHGHYPVEELDSAGIPRPKHFLWVGALLMLCFALPVGSRAQHFLWANNAGATVYNGGVFDPLGMDVDATGHMAVAGYFTQSALFFGDTMLTAAGEEDAFLMRVAPDGSLDWVERFGGATGYDVWNDVAIGPTGDLYSVGTFTELVDHSTLPWQFDQWWGFDGVVVARFDTTGAQVWTSVYTNYSVVATTIDLDGQGNVYIAGRLAPPFGNPTDVDPGPGQTLMQPSDGAYIVVKLNSNGGFVWARQFGLAGNPWADVHQLDVMDDGTITVCGGFSSSADFAPGPAVDSLYCTDGIDAFVCRLNSSGNLLWARAFNGQLNNDAITLACAQTGETWVGVTFIDSMDADPGVGVFPLQGAPWIHSALVKLDAAGQFVDGFSLPWARSIGLDEDQELLVSGMFLDSADMDPGPGVYTLYGSLDVYVLRLDTANNLEWVVSWADGYAATASLHVASTVDGGVLNIATYQGLMDFDPGPAVHAMPATANSMYVLKLAPSGVGMSSMEMPRVKVHPVPTTGPLHVSIPLSGGAVAVRVLDATGRQVLRSSLGTDGILDLSGLGAGIYTLIGGPRPWCASVVVQP